MYVVRNSYQDLRLGCRWLTRDVHYYCYYSITNTSKYRWGARAYTSHNISVRGSGSSVWHVIFKPTPSLQTQRTRHPFLELLRSLIPTPLSTNVNQTNPLIMRKLLLSLLFRPSHILLIIAVLVFRVKIVQANRLLISSLGLVTPVQVFEIYFEFLRHVHILLNVVIFQ